MLFFLHFRIILIFMIKRRYLIFLLIVLSFISLFLGVSTVNLQGLLNFEGNQWQIFFISRVPRLISILIAGASLSICGLVMQQLSRNRFVSPTTAGTMDAVFPNGFNVVKNHHCGDCVFPWYIVIYDDSVPFEIQGHHFCTFSGDYVW